MNNRITILLSTLCLLVSCAPNDERMPGDDNSAWKAVLTTGETLDAEQHYHTVGIELEGIIPSDAIELGTDAEWLTIQSDTLPSDGLFDVLPESNAGGEERTAKLTLTCRTDGSTSVVEIVQKGSAGNNEYASSTYRVGHGFSCFDDYKCSTSIRGNVISEAKLSEFDGDNTFISLQEGVRGEMYYEFYSAYSLSEMQNKLTKKPRQQQMYLVSRKPLTDTVLYLSMLQMNNIMVMLVWCVWWVPDRWMWVP